MNWKYLNTGFNTGNFNMSLDVHLSEQNLEDEAIFRLYRWNPFCISLGANQNINSVNKFKAEEDGIDIVKRPTGGRAILHAEELTYSVIYPVNQDSSVRDLYHDINLALLGGLKIYDSRLSEACLENNQPDFRELYKENIGSICFAASARSEIKYKGKKLIGSAQRKFNNAILQHGSILCGSFHKNIVDYLNLSPVKKAEIKEDISNKTTDLKNILNEEINFDRLSFSLLKGFEIYFNTKFEELNSNQFLMEDFVLIDSLGSNIYKFSPK